LPPTQQQESDPGVEADIAEAREVDALTAQEQQDFIGAQAPAAEEPLDPVTLQALADTTFEAMSRLSAGQTDEILGDKLQQIDPAEAGSVPPPLWTPIAALFAGLHNAAGLGVAAAQQYLDINPQELGASNAGLQELTARIQEIGADTKLAQALSKPPPGGAPAAPEEAAPAAAEPEAPGGGRAQQQAEELLG